MHCPNCREDNAPMTRFCTSCGAVLVEEAPGGGRRRVLRPWGLRNSAPLTISPDLPDLVLSPIVDERRAWRMDLGLAGAVIAMVVLVAALHPWLRRAAAEPTSRVDERVVAAPVAMSVATPPIVHETRLAAPALVERAPANVRPDAIPAKAAVSPPATAIAPRPSGARGLPAVPVTYAMPPREAILGDGQGVNSPDAPGPEAVSVPAAEPDRWQVLRSELHRCQPLGLFDRATCEQRARLAHCDSYWGHVALCPSQRAESGR